MPELVERTYHLAYAVARVEGLFAPDDLGQALHESWKPGRTVKRYGRRWRLTRVLDESDEHIFGQIGFVDDEDANTLIFDDERQEFVRREASRGVVVPFAVDKRGGLIAHQLWPGVVRGTTFTGALGALLNSDDLLYDWRVQSVVEQREFSDWLKETAAVTRFRFTLERPNPHYFGNKRIEDAIESIEAQVVSLAAAAREGGSIDTKADLFRQALDHVTHEYGRGVVEGRDRDGSSTTWIKVRGAVASVLSKVRRRAVGPEEVSEAILVDVLKDAPLDPELEAADLNSLEAEPAE